MELSELLVVAVVLGTLIGLLMCFFGYRLFKIVLGLVGFIAGAILAFMLCLIASERGTSISDSMVLPLTVLGGVIGALLLVGLHFLGVLVIGGVFGAVVAIMFCAVAEIYPEPAYLIIPAILGGILALSVEKLMIILATAFEGAWAAVTGAAFLLPDGGTGFLSLGVSGNLLAVIVLSWLVLAILGVVVQYSMAPRQVPRLAVAGDSTPGSPPPAG